MHPQKDVTVQPALIEKNGPYRFGYVVNGGSDTPGTSTAEAHWIPVF